MIEEKNYKWKNKNKYQNSHTVKKVLGPTTDFPTWGSGKGTENPQGIWFWRPVGFDYRTYTGLGKQTLGRHKRNFVCTRIQEKGAVSPQETEPDLPVSVQEPLVEAWLDSDLLWGQGHWIQQGMNKSFWRRLLLPLSLPQFGRRLNNREGTQPCPSTGNWIKDLLSMTQFPPQSVFHQEASISLLSLAIRGTIIVCYRKSA